MYWITRTPIDENDVLAQVRDPAAGAIVTFTGIVREVSRGKKVQKLFYETHQSMAETLLEKIVREAKTRWRLKKVAIQHRIGMLQVGDCAVVISVAAKHRKSAFQACQFIIDKIKKDVPIWKKEYYDDGEEWVE